MTTEDVLLIGCYTGDHGGGTGIAAVSLADGVPDAVIGVTPADTPSFVVRHPVLDVVYAVNEFAGGVSAWTAPGGIPAEPLGSGDTGGTLPCHLTVAGEYLVTVNYGGGSVAVHRLGPDGSIGERTDLVVHTLAGTGERQDSAHAHMVRIDGDALLVTDLGGDSIYRYMLTDGKLVLESVISAPTGSGPRHLTKAGDRWYVAAELSNEVLTYGPGWELLGRVPASSARGESYPSEIMTRGDGRYLYVANRGPDTLSVFTLGGGLPEYVTEVPTGKWPRHFSVAGDEFIYIANQLSDELTTMRIDAATGIPAPVATYPVPSPTSVLLPRK